MREYLSPDVRKNATLLAFLEPRGVRKEPTKSDPYVLNGYELHAHPDLIDRLVELKGLVPESMLAAAFGIPMLMTPDGRAFAYMSGSHYLQLFLPMNSVWGKPVEELKSDWQSNYAWDTRSLIEARNRLPVDEAIKKSFEFALQF